MKVARLQRARGRFRRPKFRRYRSPRYRSPRYKSPRSRSPRTRSPRTRSPRSRSPRSRSPYRRAKERSKVSPKARAKTRHKAKNGHRSTLLFYWRKHKREPGTDHSENGVPAARSENTKAGAGLCPEPGAVSKAGLGLRLGLRLARRLREAARLRSYKASYPSIPWMTKMAAPGEGRRFSPASLFSFLPGGARTQESKEAAATETAEAAGEPAARKRPCRACVDFKTWMKTQQARKTSENETQVAVRPGRLRGSGAVLEKGKALPEAPASQPHNRGTPSSPPPGRSPDSQDSVFLPPSISKLLLSHLPTPGLVALLRTSPPSTWKTSCQLIAPWIGKSWGETVGLSYTQWLPIIPTPLPWTSRKKWPSLYIYFPSFSHVMSVLKI
ncbi:FAD-linked sulfhydryl oxidase ALR isoform X1 [Sminthopsis crassicaudata]|uniref:FAD-linked sulfhydryl oxidase ALR isoform X1 n=1 Tax=Sminthopsis crassicaudata TaxID=9301 RepID=UPI003D69E9D9